MDFIASCHPTTTAHNTSGEALGANNGACASTMRVWRERLPPCVVMRVPHLPAHDAEGEVGQGLPVGVHHQHGVLARVADVLHMQSSCEPSGMSVGHARVRVRCEGPIGR